MSRIGEKPIPVPEGVEIKISSGYFEVKGSKGNIKQCFPVLISIEYDEKGRVANIRRPDDEKPTRAFQGLTRALLANAVSGVVSGFEKTLDVVGTGYKAEVKGKSRTLELSVGYGKYPKKVMVPEGITVEVPEPTRIVIKGCDKQLVGQFAANVRRVRPPDAYKGKGIRYTGEVVKLKATKVVGG